MWNSMVEVDFELYFNFAVLQWQSVFIALDKYHRSAWLTHRLGMDTHFISQTGMVWVRVQLLKFTTGYGLVQVQLSQVWVEYGLLLNFFMPMLTQSK